MDTDDKIEIYIKLLKSNIPLNFKQLKAVSEKTTEILKKEPNVIEINNPVTICGHILGNFEGLIEIFKIGGSIPETNYLFLGNYISSEPESSVEVISLLFCLKILYPKRIILLRGSENIWFVQQGFLDELRTKIGNDKIFNIINEVFISMPLIAVINDSIFCVHSGLSPEIEEIKQINNLDRFHDLNENYYPQINIIQCLVQSQPIDKKNKWYFGDFCLKCFNQEVTKDFIEKNNLKKIVCSGKTTKNGYYYEHNNNIILLHSCPIRKKGNNGAILQIDEYNNENFIAFNIKETKNIQLKNKDYFCNTWFFYEKINKMVYDIYVYEGILSLRIKLKDNEYKAKIEEKIKNDDLINKNKLLFRICCLPENHFFNVIKYALS